MEIILVILSALGLFSVGGFTGKALYKSSQKKAISSAKKKEGSAPKRIEKSPLTLGPGFEVRVNPAAMGGYVAGYGALQKIEIIDSNTRQPVTGAFYSWEKERTKDIQTLMGSSTYQKELVKAAKKRANAVPVHKVELAMDASEVDRMKVDTEGNLIIPPARTFELPEVPPLLRWSIRGERGRSILSLLYVESPSQPQVLCEMGLPETGDPEENILSSAIALLAEADVAYGENLDVYVSKVNSLYRDYEGEW